MSKLKKIIKDDANFLEYPNWVIDSRTKGYCWTVKKSRGTYEISGMKGLPNHFDKLVLYSLLHFLYKNRFKTYEVETTRYEIAKAVFEDATKASSNRFNRIMLALERWKSVSIRFEGIFYEGESYTIRGFSIIDSYMLNTATKKLRVRFNEDYIRQLNSSNFYKLIDFDIYRLLSNMIAVRLYELLVKIFKDQAQWRINIESLAEKLTISKRPQSKAYYPSDIIAKLMPALREINEKTELFVNFTYNQEERFCYFNKKNKALEEESLLDNYGESSLLDSFTMSTERKHYILKHFNLDKIEEKVNLLKKYKDIKSHAAWLIKALKNDWTDYHYQQKLKEEQAKKERAAQKREALKRAQRLEKLKQEHLEYLEHKALELYKLLPAKIVKSYETEYKAWLKEQQSQLLYPIPEYVLRNKYLQELLLEDEDLNFSIWLKNSHNIDIEKKHSTLL